MLLGLLLLGLLLGLLLLLLLLGLLLLLLLLLLLQGWRRCARCALHLLQLHGACRASVLKHPQGVRRQRAEPLARRTRALLR